MSELELNKKLFRIVVRTIEKSGASEDRDERIWFIAYCLLRLLIEMENAPIRLYFGEQQVLPLTQKDKKKTRKRGM